MISKGPSRADERKEKQREREATRRAVYAAVDKRDRYRCRACKGPADPKSPEMLRRGHHHHVTFRSRGGQDDAANVVLLCAVCHAEAHRYTLSVTGNANGNALQFERVEGDGATVRRWQG